MARGERICVTCSQSKPLTEFHYKNRQKGTHQEKCKICSKQYAKDNYNLNREERLKQINERQRAIRIENRKLFNSFLELGKCSVCVEEDFRCLTSNIDNDSVTFKTTEDLKLLLANGVIKCLNCDARSRPV